MIEKVIQELKEDEGYRAEKYQCSEGVWTVGYGTTLPFTSNEIEKVGKDLPLDKERAEILLRMRLNDAINGLNVALPWLEKAPEAVKEVLYNMAYQLGVKGVLKFKKSLDLIERKEYFKASIEMLNSRWHKQTPNRAERLSEKIRGLSAK